MSNLVKKKNVNSVAATLANWRTSPICKSAFHRVREIIPSAEIRNNPADIWALKAQSPPFDTSELSSLIEETSTDAVVIAHDNKLIFESYHNGMKADDQHILFSVSKSLLGLITGCLIRDGIVAESQLITAHLPEMRGTAYDKATIRDALDMRIGVCFDEDYTAQEGPIIDYRYAANWNPTPQEKAGITLKSFLISLKETDGPHGQHFHYTSPNTDLLAWLFERASGKRYSDLLSDYLFKPIGCERSAYITVDKKGGMRAAGGICMTPRDLARIGMLVVQNGMRDKNIVIPPEWIENFYQSGDQKAWDNGSFKDFFKSTRMYYRSKWYSCQKIGHLLFGFGIHGQYLFIDRDRKLSIAWLSSESTPLNNQTTEQVLSIVNKIRCAL